MTHRLISVVIVLLIVLPGIQIGADFYQLTPSPLSLGLDSSSTFQSNGLAAGIDSPRLPMVAGVSTSSDSWFSLFNILRP